jgi:glycosyltransferase involved in cell wall biosynthesis
MRVGCNLLWLVPGRVGGTEMATVALMREIAADPPPDIDLTIYALDVFGQTYPDVVEAFPSHLAPLTGRLRSLRVAAENSWLARVTNQQVDLVHHMGGTLPVLRGTPGVVTIHDLQPFDLPQNFQPAKRAYLQHVIPRSVRRAAGVIVPTEFVRQGILDRFDIVPDRVRLAPWGVEPPTTQVSVAQVQARYGLPRRWFTFPSYTWNHKNHGMLLRAFATVAAREHDVMLVLTGGEGPAESAVVEQIERLGLRGRVRRTGLIPRRDVLAIVRGAVAMTFPSRYEGFGLPVLEAMSLGTPVLASDAAALPEVVGDAARLVPVEDTDAWVDEMTRMLHDGAERQRLADAGRVRVAGFTWQRTAADTLAAYRAYRPAAADVPASRAVDPVASADPTAPATAPSAPTVAEPAVSPEAAPTDPGATP